MLSNLIRKDYHPYLMRIFTKPWVLILLFLPFFKPESFAYLPVPFPQIDTLLTLAKAVIFVLAALLYLADKKISPFMVSIGVFNLIYLVSTLINHGNLKTALVTIVSTAGVCLLAELAIRFSFSTFLKSVFFLLSAFLILHLLSQLIFPNGMAKIPYYYYACYFLNIDNQMAPFLFLEMLVTILYSEFFYQRITWPAVGMLAVTSIILLKSWSASALVGWFVFFVFLIFFYRRKYGRFIQFLTVSIAYVVIFFSIVVLRLQNLFSFIIVDILHKDLTLTHRTEFWDYAFTKISQNWLYGLGEAVEKGHVWSSYYSLFYNGHNIILELLLDGGIILLAAFLVTLFLCGRKVHSVRRHPWATLVSGALFSFFVVMLLETYNKASGFWIMLVIAYQLPICIAQKEEFEQEHPGCGERKGLSLKLYDSYTRLKNRVIRRNH